MSENPTLQLERGGEIIEVALPLEHFSIDPSDIDSALCALGRLVLYYGQLETELKAEVERKEARFKTLEAELDTEHRQAAKSTGEKVTEKVIETRVLQAEKRTVALQSLQRSQSSHNLAKWACRALQGKKDCLIALAYRDKELLKSDRYSS